MKTYQRRAVVNQNGDMIALLKKGYRGGPFGNFEYGRRDADGILHVKGIAHIQRVRLEDRELWGEVGDEWFESCT